MKTYIKSLKYLFYTQKQKRAVLNQMRINSEILRLKLVAPLTEDDIDFILGNAERIASVSGWSVFDVLRVVERVLIEDVPMKAIKGMLAEWFKR